MEAYRGFNNSFDVSLNIITLPCIENNASCSEHHTDDTESKYTSKLSPTADIILGCYILIVCISSVILNLLVILTVVRRRRSVTPLEIYVINMAVVDLCPTLLAYPVTSVSAFSHRWVLGDLGCDLSGLSVYFFGIAGITNLTVMSIMRYVVTCRHKSEVINRRFVILTLIPVYGNAVVWCLTPMFGWGSYGPEQSGISCALEWRHLPLSYVITCFTSLFVLPIVIMVFCYCCIIREVYITQKGTQMIRKRMDIYMIKMTIMMTLCFLAAWTPYCIVAFLASKPWSREVPVSLSVAAAFMAKSSSFYNPIVYVFTVKRFRQEMVQVLFCFVTTQSNITMATRFSLNDVKPGFQNQKESDLLLSEEQRTPADQPTDQLDGQGITDQQEEDLLVKAEVKTTQDDLKENQTLYEMPYMGPQIMGSPTQPTQQSSEENHSNNTAKKKDSKVMFKEIED